MDFDLLREYALSKKAATEGMPFGDSVLVFKVMNKIFMMMNFKIPFELSLKCDPERAIELRERYDAIEPGFHLNKTHWNTVTINGSLSKKLVLEMIDHSYDIIVDSLSKKIKQEYNSL
jgi:predicted DNA-binding protein (MmcQ/YjbR family)